MMTPPTHRPAVNAGGAATWMLTVALALSLALAAAAFIDQLASRSLAEHVRATYAPYGLHPDANVLYYLLYTVAGIGALLWLITAARARKRSPRVMTIVSTAIMAMLAVLMLMVTEYGALLFPPFWGILALLSPAAGALAATLLFRRADESPGVPA